MDAYEATRIVFSRIQNLDPENAAKIMGLLLIQDHGEKEMIRLAFGPETLLHSVILKARKELNLHPASTPTTPSTAPPSPFLLARQNSTSSRLVSPPSWAPPQPFSRTNEDDQLQNLYGAEQVEDFQLQEQLSFLNDQTGMTNELFYGDGGGYGMGWAHQQQQQQQQHRRSCSMGAAGGDLCLSPDAAGGGFGWKPCLYFARGYCKNGSSCRFLHGLPDEAAAAVVEQQCQELLLRSKSQRLMASAAPFPYSPTGSSSSKCLNFVLQQQQQNESQRAAAAAAAAAALMLGGDEQHKFMGRARMERCDFGGIGGMVNPGSRQIYLTFPADSTFREEDVSNYFSIYGPVQDVRIPYQQKRMFGFVTFVYPETVKLILAKGNPHFVCDARVLVKPYKEKGKVPDKKQQQGERGDFSGCTTPTGLDSRDPFDVQQLGSRMYNSSQDILLRRRMEEQQQAAAELQQAIELQGLRFRGLQLLDLKSRSFSASSTSLLSPLATPTPTMTINTALSDGRSSNGSLNDSPPEDKSPSYTSGTMTAALSNAATAAAADKQQTSNSCHGFPRQTAVNAADKEEPAAVEPNEDFQFQESVEHNLPDSPFASPTKSSFLGESFCMNSEEGSLTNNNSSNSNSNGHLITSTLLPATSTLENMASIKSCFFQMPRFSSTGHGAVGL